MRNRLFSFFKKGILTKDIGAEINHLDFPELSDYLFSQFNKQSDSIRQRPPLTNNIVLNISRQIFEIIKIPILYTYNELYSQKEANELKINKGELIYDCFNKFPELEIIFNISCQQYVQYFSELLKRLLSDEKEIIKHFNISGNPISVEWPLGDFHNGGKSHAIINYSCGSKIVYKVKSPDGSLIFEKIIKSISNKGYELPYLFPGRLTKYNYYWEEYISHVATDDKQILYSFYETIGKYLAIFYVLGISDIIRDNIIANNGKPVFIDIECLLKPILKTSDKDVFPSADNFLKESVIGTGLLPFWTPLRANDAGINFGGISQSELYTPKLRLYVGNNRKMVYEFKNVLKHPTHIPFKNQQLPTKVIYQNISKGFIDRCHFLITHKKWLAKYIRELVDDSDISSRILMRNTNVYDTIIKESLHPDYLTNSHDRYLFLNYLDNSFDKDCFPQGLIDIEKQELKNLNVPVFYSNPTDRTIFYKGNHFEIIEVSGVDSMLKRLNKLSADTIKAQNTLIEKSIACFEKISSFTLEPKKKEVTNSFLKEYGNDSLFVKNHVIKLADRILQDSLWIDDSFQWIDIGVGRTGQWEVSPKKPGIYDGLDGLGLFYLYLYDTTKIGRFKKATDAILRKTLFAFEQFDPSKSYHLFSPFNFPFSTLYFLWHYHKVIGENEFVDVNELLESKLIPFVIDHIPSESYLDFANGCSGLLIFLLDYYNYSGLKSIERPIHLIVQRILKSAVKTPNGITWQSEKFKNLVGFAHGNAGFLYSLSKYYGIFGYNKHNIKFIHDIIRYNDSYYSQKHNGWKDLRYKEETIAAPSWCHGSSGISLAYLEAKKQLPLTCSIDWHEIAKTIAQKGFSSLHCLCHGMVGNAEALIAIGDFINYPEFKKVAKDKLLCEIQKNQDNFNWRTGFTNGKFSLNGLFLGTSGIGYNLLKIFVNPNMPSILTLQPPVLTKKTIFP